MSKLLICVLIMCALALWVLAVEFALVFIKPKAKATKTEPLEMESKEKRTQKQYIDDVNALLNYTGDEQKK